MVKRRWSASQRKNFNATMLIKKQSSGMEVAELWRNEQRPSHIYIQVEGRLCRYVLRSVEVYLPEDTEL